MKTQTLGYVEIPLQRVHVELTNVCDFNCRFCPKSQMTRPYGYMATDLAKRIITEIGQKNVSEKVTFHVMGEPTLHPDFFTILDHTLGQGVKVGLTTNGGGLGGKIGARLAAYGLQQIDVSIQTPDESSFVLREAKHLTFSAYIDGILDFFSTYAHRHPDTIVKFRFMNTRFRQEGLETKKGPVRLISSNRELREMFRYWTGRIYDILGVDDVRRASAFKKIGRLVSYKWNVVEIYPNVFFETYVLNEWGNAFDPADIRNAWAGYCFGMRDHFSILYNGDVTLCCVDFNGRTAIGNVTGASLEEVLGSKRLGDIIRGFKRFRLVHPYCQKCLGSKSITSWLVKPIGSILGLKVMKPFFYTHTDVYH